MKKYNLIHITGSDCSGKSTLVKALSEIMGYPTIHFDKPKDLEDGKQQYFNFINTNERDIICDRLHCGEWIYAPLYRNYMGDYLTEFEKELKEKTNYLLVHVKADLDTILERARTRGEDFVKEEHFQIVLDSFEKFVQMQALPYITIDTTNSKTEEDVQKILNKFKELYS